jgi:type IV pilus assembly protein PilN
MVRINLLPQKREARRSSSEGSQTWLLAILGVIVLEIVVLLFVHKAKEDDLVRIQRKSEEIKASIDEIKRQTAAHTEVKAELKLLRDREEAIQRLQSARTGPTATLLELTRILTPGRGPTTDRDKLEQLKRDNPASAPNMNWDTRRLWLTSFVESARLVKIGGLARDGEDVSEFLRRLTLSDYFADVTLLPATRTVDAVTKLEVVKFDLSAKVKY